MDGTNGGTDNSGDTEDRYEVNDEQEDDAGGADTDDAEVTEPWLACAVLEGLAPRGAIFASNSMPVRDLDAFAGFHCIRPQPANEPGSSAASSAWKNGAGTGAGAGVASDWQAYRADGRVEVVANRGASGIDGIISAGMGYALGRGREGPTTLVLGDMAALHDLSSFHVLASDSTTSSPSDLPPMTVIAVNNGGGAIFSFLPIAKHGNDVDFSRFFTAAHDVNLGAVAGALGLHYERVNTRSAFTLAYTQAQARAVGSQLARANTSDEKTASKICAFKDGLKDAPVSMHVANGPEEEICSLPSRHTVIEVIVPEALEEGAISMRRNPSEEGQKAVRRYLLDSVPLAWTRYFASNPPPQISAARHGHRGRPVVLLHGFMGSQADWEPVIKAGQDRRRSHAHDIIVLDLPLHAGSQPMEAGLSYVGKEIGNELFGSLEFAARAVEQLLGNQGIGEVHIVGYSLGGRVALTFASLFPQRVASLSVLSAHPGIRNLARTSPWGETGGSWESDLNDGTTKVWEAEQAERQARQRRLESDEAVARTVEALHGERDWIGFLESWYSTPMWGNLRQRSIYPSLLQRRIRFAKATSLAAVLRRSSLGRQSDAWNMLSTPLWDPTGTDHRDEMGTVAAETVAVPKILFVHGSLDDQYGTIAGDIGAMASIRAITANRKASSGWKRGSGSWASGVRIESVEGAGHAVVEEEPMQVEKLLFDHIDSVEARSGQLRGQEQKLTGANACHPNEQSDQKAEAEVQMNIGAVRKRDWDLSLTSPLHLFHSARSTSSAAADVPTPLNSGNVPCTEESVQTVLRKRRGMDIIIQVTLPASSEINRRLGAAFSRRGAERIGRGVGEVSPLPGFHTESRTEAEAQFEAVRKGLLTTPLPIELTAALLAEDGEKAVEVISRWLDAIAEASFSADPVPLSNHSSLPARPHPFCGSLRWALETALLQAAADALDCSLPNMLSRAAASPDDTPILRSRVLISGLLTRSPGDLMNATAISSLPSQTVKPGEIGSSFRRDESSSKRGSDGEDESTGKGDGDRDGEYVLKIKVGDADVEAEAKQVTEIVQRDQREGRRRRIRLDANQVFLVLPTLFHVLHLSSPRDVSCPTHAH